MGRRTALSGPRGARSAARIRCGAALALALAAGPVAQGCVWYPRPATTPSTDPAIYVVGWTQDGIASWYGPPFHGRPAASGVSYDMEAMTAAHQTIPFGTRIRVDNRDNGRTADLLVNDRGPFLRGRILDVSRAAARALGMLEPGTARVRITVIGAADAVSARGGCVVVQVASYLERTSAGVKQREIEEAGFEAAIEPFEGVYRVVAGPFLEEAAVRRAAEALGGFLRRC